MNPAGWRCWRSGGRSAVALASLCVALAAAAFAGQDRALPAPSSSASPRRIALCLGNAAYLQGALKNPVNDATAMGQALTEMGFDVELGIDLDTMAMERAVNRFIGKLGTADVGFLFYAGHGIQVDGENYLLPTDFRAEDEVEARYRGYKADVIRERMEKSGSRVNIIVLDACRDNPFRFSRSGSRGLAGMESGRGTLVALATGPGQTASDNPGSGNGLFTEELLKVIRQPGLRIQEVFERTKLAVAEASGQRQRPWLHSDLTGDFYLQDSAVASGAPSVLPSAPPATMAQPSPDALACEALRSSRSPGAFEAYLKEFPTGICVGLARVRLAELQSAPKPVGSSLFGGPVPSVPPAEPPILEGPFKLEHLANSLLGWARSLHAGSLTVSPGRVVWTEGGGKDKFDASCADIDYVWPVSRYDGFGVGKDGVKYSANAHIVVGKKNYDFFTAGGFPTGQAVVDAIRVACPAVRLKEWGQ